MKEVNSTVIFKRWKCHHDHDLKLPHMIYAREWSGMRKVEDVPIHIWKLHYFFFDSVIKLRASRKKISQTLKDHRARWNHVFPFFFTRPLHITQFFWCYLRESHKNKISEDARKKKRGQGSHFPWIRYGERIDNSCLNFFIFYFFWINFKRTYRIRLTTKYLVMWKEC